MEVKLAWPLQKGSIMKEKERALRGWQNKEGEGERGEKGCHAPSFSGWELVLPGRVHFGGVSRDEQLLGRGCEWALRKATWGAKLGAGGPAAGHGVNPH